MMLDQANRTFICSVVFVDLVGYSKKAVAEQVSLKDRFTGVLTDALKDIAVNDRIILDTGDGAAMSFLGDPEDALFVAMSLRDNLRASAVVVDGAAGRDEDDGLIRIGINLGPVKLVKDINGHPNIIGDGINVAQRIMTFAHSGQIVVSRSYYDVVSCLSEEYVKLFHYEGSRTDKHVREHEIYVVGESESAFKVAKRGMENRASTNPKARPASGSGSETGTIEVGAFGTDMEYGFFHDRRKVVLSGILLAALVALLAVLLVAKKPLQTGLPVLVPAGKNAVLVASDSEHAKGEPATPPGAPPAIPAAPASETQDAAKAVAASAQAAPAVEPAKPETAKPEPVKAEPVKAEIRRPEPVKAPPAKPELPPGTVNFSIAPWGEVFVNGKSRGVSPPMKNLKLPPGKYNIEIRNTTFARHVEAIDVKSREEITIRHKF